MKTISSLVDQVIKKYAKQDAPALKENLTNNLEFRLLFTIDFSKPFKEAKKEFLKSYFEDLLTLTLGNVSMAAKKAQIHRRHMHRFINELELDVQEHRKEMLKPSNYIKEHVQHIVEETLEQYKSQPYVKSMYQQVSEISEDIAQHLHQFSYDEAIDLFEKEYIKKALAMHNHDVEKTAEFMEMSSRSLYRKMSKLGLN